VYSSSSSLQQRDGAKKTDGASTTTLYESLKSQYALFRAGITGEKVGELRVGDSLVNRLRDVDMQLDAMQEDIYRDAVDWQVVQTYTKIFRAYTPLFAAYTDRAFPSDSEIDVALRYALRYEVGGFYSGVQDFENAVTKQSARQAQRAFARMSIAYDHFIKAGDLYENYEDVERANTEAGFLKSYFSDQTGGQKLLGMEMKQGGMSYIAPSIEAPGLQDEVVLLKGPDKGRTGIVLWITKGDGNSYQGASPDVVVKLKARSPSPSSSSQSAAASGAAGSSSSSDRSETNSFAAAANTHSEVRQYPYSIVAKTTPPDVQFVDDLLAAYIASAISSGIMYPIDTYKTRIQSGQKGIPPLSDGGFWGLWKGVPYFIADPNDAVYIASYGLLKPALLAPVDVTNPFQVFTALTLAGSIGDAVGSIFRVPMEIVYKKVQTGATSNGRSALMGLLKSPNAEAILLSWLAVLCRDVPFAGLQIALFDVFKNALSFLDDQGWSTFAQRALWGASAGGTAAFLTTPFDILTTNIINAAEGREVDQQDKTSSSPSSSILATFEKAWKDVFSSGGGVSALFTGAVPRMLFFSPAAMIFFAVYETCSDVFGQIRSGNAFWQ